MRYLSSFPRRAVVLLAILASGCASPKGANVGEKTAEVRRMRDATLQELYREEPGVRSRLQRAAGYAVFSNRGSQLLLSTGSGFGVAVENRSGRETFMRMAEVGVGLGLGIKDYRTIFLFHDAATLRKFIDDGWEFGSEADAAAKVGEHGSQISGAGAAGSTIEVYQFTENGLALRAAVSGTRYWKDDELNARG